MKTQETRCYIFSHFMLSTMAKGIQGLHSTVELFNEYGSENALLNQWSKEDKTVILLDAGVSEHLEDTKVILTQEKYPSASFSEDDFSLKGLMTSCSIILPEEIYATALMIRTKKIEINNFMIEPQNELDEDDLEFLTRIKDFKFTQEDLDIIILINSKRLAQ